MGDGTPRQVIVAGARRPRGEAGGGRGGYDYLFYKVMNCLRWLTLGCCDVCFCSRSSSVGCHDGEIEPGGGLFGPDRWVLTTRRAPGGGGFQIPSPCPRIAAGFLQRHQRLNQETLLVVELLLALVGLKCLQKRHQLALVLEQNVADLGGFLRVGHEHLHVVGRWG